MKTSTGTPTRAQAARMDAIKNGPCVCCHMRRLPSCWPEIHHMLSGGKRIGHDATIGACSWHHRGVMLPGWTRKVYETMFGPSLAHGSKPFHREFGSDADLLAYQNRLLAGSQSLESNACEA